MKIIIMTITLMISWGALAYKPTCSKNGTVIIFSNGIEIDRGTTFRYLKHLESKGYTDSTSFRSILDKNVDSSAKDKPENVSYVNIYNVRNQDDSLPYLIDKIRVARAFILSETLRRGITLDQITLGKLIASTILKSYDFLNSAVNGNILTAMVKLAIGEVKDILVQEIEAEINNKTSVVYLSLVTNYRNYLNQGKRIIALPHGDGVLFTNEAWSKIFDPSFGSTLIPSIDKRDFFVTVAIGPIVNPISEKSFYRLFYGDRYARNLIPPVGFFTPAPNMCDPAGQRCGASPIAASPEFHDFQKIYLDWEPASRPSSDSEFNGTLGAIIEGAEKLKSSCEEFGCGGKVGQKINETVFVAETALVEEGANLGGNVEICETAKVRSGASISAVRGNARIGGNSEIQAGTFINADSGIINILNSTLQGSFTITRTGSDISKAKIDISDSIVFGNIYCESILFATGSCSINISGSTLINAQGGVVARGPMKNAVINIVGSTISGVVSSDALFADSVLNVFGQNICSGSSYSALNGVITTNINEVCSGTGPALP